MKLALLFLMLAGSALAGPINEGYAERLADAIYAAEGREKAKVPYGILSVRTANPRRTCLETIRKNWERWELAGRPGEYLEFLANRYAPVGASNDPRGLNRNWLRNVKNRLNTGSRYAVESK